MTKTKVKSSMKIGSTPFIFSLLPYADEHMVNLIKQEVNK